MKDCTMCEHEQDGTMGDYCRLLEQEIDSLQPPICEGKCASCAWWAREEMVCCNADSPWVADFTLADDTCEEWEGEDDN